MAKWLSPWAFELFIDWRTAVVLAANQKNLLYNIAFIMSCKIHSDRINLNDL